MKTLLKKLNKMRNTLGLSDKEFPSDVEAIKTEIKALEQDYISEKSLNKLENLAAIKAKTWSVYYNCRSCGANVLKPRSYCNTCKELMEQGIIKPLVSSEKRYKLKQCVCGDWFTPEAPRETKCRKCKERKVEMKGRKLSDRYALATLESIEKQLQAGETLQEACTRCEISISGYYSLKKRMKSSNPVNEVQIPKGISPEQLSKDIDGMTILELKALKAVVDMAVKDAELKIRGEIARLEEMLV